MDPGRADSIACLRIPGLHLPKAGIEFSTVLLQLLVVHGFIQAFHFLIFARLRVTPIVTQMFTGIFLSPFTPLMRDIRVYREIHLVVFPRSSRNVDESLAMISYMMYSFIVAVKMDFSIILKTGRKAFAIGILDSMLPVILNLWFLVSLYPDLYERVRSHDKDVADQYINLITLPMTHFPNVAALLGDLKMMNSELGRLTLASALIGQILSMLLILIANVIARRIDNPLKLITPFALVVVSIYVFKPILNWMIKQTPKGRPVRQLFVSFGYLLMFVGALTTEYAEQLILLGAFIVGAAVPDGLPLGAAIVDKLEFFVTGLFLPFFVTTALMGGDYIHMGASETIMRQHLTLATLAYCAKFFSSLFSGLYCNMEFTDSLALGFIMSIKGIVDIGTLIMFRESDVLSTPSYTVMLLWTLFIAIFTPFFVRSLYHPLKKYAGYQRRDIMHCKFNSELRILACFMRPDCVASVTRLLTACCPSETNTIALYALHLVRLIGRTHPIFIAHDVQKKKVASGSYSEDVIWALYRFGMAGMNFLSIHIFTAVSPSETFHEDTCTLALDKLVSVIVLPFHRKFRFDGSIDSEDKEQKALNSDLLNKSPCSVAIFVDRGSFGQINTESAPTTDITTITTTDSTSPVLVAVIYLGGLDDQETLALAKRMGRDSRIRVFVIRLVAFGQSRDIDALDSAALMDIQSNEMYNQQFTYVEKAVKDGADTAAYLTSMLESYNLVMVGRQYNFACSQLIGLKDMSEETELGAIGGFLASKDVVCKTSVLVVQQQKHWAFK